MSQPWYRRFPDNFLGGINGLSLEEKGAYSVVIDMIYQRGGPIADEPRYIAGICNCSVRKWNAIRQRLLDLGKLRSIDGHLTNDRAEEELEKAAKVAREHAENGSKGGDKSAENRAVAKENKDIGQAGLKLTRASSTSTPFKKEGEIDLKNPTETLVEVSQDSEDFAALTVYRKRIPIVGKRFTTFVAPAVLAAARKAYGIEDGDMGQGRAA